MKRPEGYDAATGAAAIITRSDEGFLEVTGADRASWLQGLLTNDIEALFPGRWCYSAYLTPQGRMIADLHVLAFEERLLLRVPAVARERTRERFEQFIITEDVTIADRTGDIVMLSLVGPESPAVAARMLAPASFAVPQVGAQITVERTGVPLVVAGSRDAGLPQLDVYVPATSVEELVRAAIDAGAAPLGDEAWETLRIEAGRPVFGRDMDESTIPLEAGIEDRAISFTKGCYVGQEIIVRVLHRGGGRVARKLVGLSFESSDRGHALGPGLPLVHDGREVGRVTSAGWSPRLGRPIALGYVARDFAEPGTPLEAGAGTGRRAVVVALPIVPPDAAAGSTS